MKFMLAMTTLAALAAVGGSARAATAPDAGPPTRTTFVRLANNANAIIVEPVTPVPGKSRIALITHPENANNFNYFTAREMPRRLPGDDDELLRPRADLGGIPGADRGGNQGTARPAGRGEGGVHRSQPAAPS